jgi:hypothetical protein
MSENQKPENQKPEDKENDYREDWTRRRYWGKHVRYGGMLTGLFWGLLLILIGALFYANNMGWLTGEWWQYFLVGLGGILIIDAAVRFFTKTFRWGIYGRFIAGIILIFLGLAFLFGWSQWWPLVLIAVGLAILVGAIVRRSK